MTTETGGQPVELAGQTTVEAVAERIRELEVGPVVEIATGEIRDSQKLAFESLENQDGKVVRNPEYLKFLGKLDQEYVDERLDKEGMVRVRNVAVMSIDIAGFSNLAQEFLQASWGDQRGTYAAKKVVDQIAPVREEILSSVHLFGGEVDQFLGDGMNVMFRGGTPEENVARSVQAAELLRSNIKEHYQFDIRIGIDIGDVELVGYGSETEKRADMIGSAVQGAEKVQSQADVKGGYNVTLSEKAYALMEDSQFTVLENGVYALGEIGKNDSVNVADWVTGLNEESTDLALVENTIRVREKFLSKSRRKELRSEFLYGTEPRQDASPVSTVFVRLNVAKMDYQELNPIMTEVFDIAGRLRGKVDKVHNNTVMINFIAHLNDVNSVEASKLVADYLTDQRVGFDMAASRSEALVLAVDGVRTVYGDGVIRARRLLDVNNPGNRLVVDKSVMDRMLTRKVSADSIPPVRVKGFSEPVERFVITKIERSYELPKGKHLAGREIEIKVLEDDFELARKEGQSRILIGEPGIGKSALTAEFLARKQKGGLMVMVGRAEASTQKQAFSVWRNLLEGSLSLKDMLVKDKEVAIKEFYLSNCPVLSESLALLNPILGTNFEEGEKVKYLDAVERDQSRAEFVMETIKSLTSVGVPAAVLLEDLHFFDPSSEALAREVMKRVKDSDIYIVLTTWPKDDEHKLTLPRKEFMRELADVKTLELGGLPVFGGDYDTAKDTVEFEQWWQANKEVWWQAVDAFLDLDRKDFEKKEMGYRRIFTKLAEKTQGNFLYLGNAIFYLAIYQGERRYFEEDQNTKLYSLCERIQDEQFANIPSTESIIQYRLGMLDIEIKNLAQDASVVGLVFTSEVVSLISGVPIDRVRSSFAYAEQKGFTKELGGGQWMFVHGAIQNAVYNSIADLRRRQLKHRELAQYFEKTSPDDLPLLVRHYRNSDDYLKAMKYLDQYAERLKEQVLWGPALDQIHYASKIFDKVHERGWKIVDIGSTTYKGESIQLDLEQIEKLVHEEIDRAMAALMLQRKIGDRNKTLPIIERAQDLFNDFHGRGNVESLPIHDRLAWIRLLANEGAERATAEDKNNALTIFKEAFSLARDLDCDSFNKTELKGMSREALFDLYLAYGDALHEMSDFEASIASTKKAKSIAISLQNQIITSNQIIICYKGMGEMQLAKQGYQETISLAEKNNLKGELPTLYSNFAEFYASAGKAELAETYYDKAYEAARIIGQTATMAKARGSMAFIKRNKGEYADALHLFINARDDFARRGQVARAINATAEAAFCAVQISLFEQAEMLLKEVAASNTKFKGRGLTLHALSDLIKNGTKNRELIKIKFEQGAEQLLQDKNKSDFAFDCLYFGEALLERGFNEGMEYVLNAKRIYEEIGELAQMPRIEKILARYGKNINQRQEPVVG